MFTDIVGYSALAAKNERLAFELLEEHRTLLRRHFPLHGGDENKTIGDAFFVEFGSATDAVECAIEIQTALYERNLFSESERKLQIRIGIHLGDIIDSEGDSFGDPVNIAARVESLAEPGGLCITQQVLDHVERQLNLKFARIKKTDLKNIGTPTQLYQVVMPWNEHSIVPRVFSFARLAHRLSKTSLHVGVMACWCVALLGLFISFSAKVYKQGAESRRFHSSEEREPASIDSPTRDRKIDLGHRDWKYRVLSETGSDSTPHAVEWKPFQIGTPWKHSDEILGKYELETEFESEIPFKNPAMLLGLIPDTYRVYLNNHFIGGSGNYSSVEMFGMDPGLFVDPASGHKNILRIEAQTSRSLAPGLTVLSEMGAYIGEFDDVYTSILQYRTHFHVMRSIYLAISLIASILCMTYFCVRREKTRFLYFSLYLILGSFLLAYYNVYVSSALNYPLHRFLKVIALSLSSVILCSAWLNSTRRTQRELYNNAGGIVFFLVAGALLLPASTPAEEFLTRYNGLLYVAAFYSLFWIVIASFTPWKKHGENRKKYGESSNNAALAERLAITLFGWSGTLLIAQSLKMGVLPKPLQEWLGHWTISAPFLFSLFITFAGLFDFISKSKKIALERDRETLLLTIYEIAEKVRDEETIATRILQEICTFLTAERATIYLSDPEGQKLFAKHMVGSAQARKFIKSPIAKDEAIVGHVFSHKKPLLINDINSDLRFKRFSRSVNRTGSYRSGACMVFPLVTGKKLIGVLTIADKESGQSFSKSDFTLTGVVSKILAAWIHNRELDRELSNTQSSKVG